jgi:hypothetical protein
MRAIFCFFFTKYIYQFLDEQIGLVAIWTLLIRRYDAYDPQIHLTTFLLICSCAWCQRRSSLLAHAPGILRVEPSPPHQV